MRKLATVRKISEIRPIEGADAIELAIVDGWQTVIKKNEYRVGDLVVYCEIDSWVPTTLAPFLSKGKEPREFNGVKGERLRTVKLRGALSQGLLLPLNDLLKMKYDSEAVVAEGDDVTEMLGIQKWEMSIPAQLAGQVRGNFPTQIPKTDQERVQNIHARIKQAFEDGSCFEVTEKLEGSSCTMYLDQEGEFHVCSRNIDLKDADDNTFWKIAKKYNIESIMRQNNLFGYALQGEVVGPGIQGNIYNLNDHAFYLFDIYSVHEAKYLTPFQRAITMRLLPGVLHVPILASSFTISGNVQDILNYAEGKSVIGTIGCEREGVVFKSKDADLTFKAISNKYLIKQEL